MRAIRQCDIIRYYTKSYSRFSPSRARVRVVFSDQRPWTMAMQSSDLRLCPSFLPPNERMKRYLVLSLMGSSRCFQGSVEATFPARLPSPNIQHHRQETSQSSTAAKTEQAEAVADNSLTTDGQDQSSDEDDVNDIEESSSSDDEQEEEHEVPREEYSDPYPEANNAANRRTGYGIPEHPHVMDARNSYSEPPTDRTRGTHSQPLQTLQKLQQMLEETDYMTASTRRPTKQTTPPLEVVSRATTVTPDTTDKLWTSKDRAKYKKQQQRLRKEQEEREKRTALYTRSPPIHSYSSDDDMSDDTDDGLGYTLPNLPVYYSDTEGDSEDENEVDQLTRGPESPAGRLASSQPAPPPPPPPPSSLGGNGPYQLPHAPGSYYPHPMRHPSQGGYVSGQRTDTYIPQQMSSPDRTQQYTSPQPPLDPYAAMQHLQHYSQPQQHSPPHYPQYYYPDTIPPYIYPPYQGQRSPQNGGRFGASSPPTARGMAGQFGQHRGESRGRVVQPQIPQRKRVDVLPLSTSKDSNPRDQPQVAAKPSIVPADPSQYAAEPPPPVPLYFAYPDQYGLTTITEDNVSVDKRGAYAASA